MLLCLGLLAVRTMQFSELDGILERIQNPEQADRIRYFRGIYANQTMQRVIDSIQNGEIESRVFVFDRWYRTYCAPLFTDFETG